jgi:hypothetical protein
VEQPVSQDIILMIPTSPAYNVTYLVSPVLITAFATHALATQHGITVVLHPNATALTDLTAIYQSNLIA